MPDVKPDETEKDFIGRCIPIVLDEGTAKGNDQATAICYSLWRKQQAGKAEAIWVTRAQVQALCPTCAAQMEKKGLDRINLAAIKQMPEQMLAGLCDSLGGDPGLFDNCMDKDFGDFDPGDKESFCAWLHHECTGAWPGEHEGKMLALDTLKIGARNSAQDQERLQQIHDFAVENGAVCPPKPEVEEMPLMGMMGGLSKSLDDALIAYGGVVKALSGGKLGGYLVTFSTANDPDLSAERDFFTPETDFGEHDKTGVFYHHGLDVKLGKRAIGTGALRRDEVGVWIEAQLKLRDEYEQAVYDLAQAGKLSWSSGTAPHLVERETVSQAHRIKTWPLGLDASLTPTPAEPRNTVVALKALIPSELSLSALASPTGTPGAALNAAARAGVSQSAASESQVLANQEKSTMEITNELHTLLAETAKNAAESAVKAYTAQQKPDNDPGTLVGQAKVVQDEADRPFKSLAEEFLAIKATRVSDGRIMDARLKRLGAIKAGTGASEGIPDDGGFLLEPTLTAEVLLPLHEEGPFTRAVRKLPVSTNSNYGWINGVDETSRATGSRWGGIQGYRLAEGGTPTASRPKFRRINWELKKYAVLCYATDELLADAEQFSAVVRQGGAEELSFMANDDILNGLGVGGPLGILQSNALVSVAAETGQAAATIDNVNLLKMWARQAARAKPRATWYINTDCYPQLHQLSLTAGTAALEPRFVTYAPDGGMRIFGKPVVETEFNATLGTVGDIVLGDFSEYLFWEKGGIQSASSIHVQFLTDETVFRLIYRCDGQPSIASPLTPYKGTGNTVSYWVALATRA